MPNHGIEIIDGIPVHLKDGGMYAFQPGSSAASAQIKLGTYIDKKANWEITEPMTTWLNEYRANLTGRSRK